jgi:tRNA (cytidine/uridine-2'-O-)-methyltransferase
MPTGFIFDDKAFKRAQMDYGSNVDIIKHNNFNAFIQAIDAKRIVLLTTKVQQSYKDFQFQASDILMVGSESRGVPTEIMQQIQNQLTIPMHNTARSLNVAVAIGIVASAAFGIEL